MSSRLQPHVAVLLALVLLTRPAQTAQLVVTSSADFHDLTAGDGFCGDPLGPDGCSLRAALEEVAGLPGHDTILIDEGVAIISLSLGPLIVSANSTVLLGHAKAVIDGLLSPYGSATLVIPADSCKIGRLTLRRSRGPAIVVTGQHNQLGGPGEGLVLIDNNLDPLPYGTVVISGPNAFGNLLASSHVGLDALGANPHPNCDGVVITDGAHDNSVGLPDLAYRNLIAGNSGFGIRIENGAHSNHVAANIIGLDITGYYPIPNDSGGLVLASGAHLNLIGGDTGTAINLISGNGGAGILLRGHLTRSNQIVGNSIGPDLTGRLAVPNAGAGIALIEGASENVIRATSEGAPNVISGNRRDGILIQGIGTTGNTISGSWIGIDGYGTRAISNGRTSGHGVTVCGGASRNRIGLPDSPNTISGNNNYGILLSGPGTSENIVTGNFIGESPSGGNGWGNGAGVVIENGASHNMVGGASESDRNYMGYNYGLDFPDGGAVIIRGDGSNHNRVLGNYLGTDRGGTFPLRNGVGVIIGDGAQANEIGGAGPGEGNIISGNGIFTYRPSLGRGVHIYGERTSFNRVIGNAIGLRGDRRNALGNFGHAVVICGGASDNTVGTTTPGEGNLIAFNDGYGVLCFDQSSSRNSYRGNLWYANDSLGILNRDGSQESVPAPIIAAADPHIVSGSTVPSAMVDLYIGSRAAGGDVEGLTWLAETTADGSGIFAFGAAGLDPGDTIVVTATTPAGSTSAFSASRIVDQSTAAETDPESTLPTSIALHESYPNPFNGSTRLSFSLPVRSRIEIDVVNLLGQRVSRLLNADLPAGTHAVDWQGANDAGEHVASGLYYVVLRTGQDTRVRKLMLIR